MIGHGTEKRLNRLHAASIAMARGLAGRRNKAATAKPVKVVTLDEDGNAIAAVTVVRREIPACPRKGCLEPEGHDKAHGTYAEQRRAQQSRNAAHRGFSAGYEPARSPKALRVRAHDGQGHGFDANGRAL